MFKEGALLEILVKSAAKAFVPWNGLDSYTGSNKDLNV